MINPEILWVSDDKEKGWEGCLSIPGLRGLVPRHRRIGVRYLTRAGEVREGEASYGRLTWDDSANSSWVSVN